jgi:hypothetical protein
MQGPNLPDPIKAGDTLAKLDPTQAALFTLIFLFVCVVIFVFWREILNWKLVKAIDGVRDALIAQAAAIAENTAEQRTRAAIQDDRQARQDKQP